MQELEEEDVYQDCSPGFYSDRCNCNQSGSQHPGGGGGGDSHIKRTAMLVGKFQTNPKKVPMWVWLKQNFIPKRYQSETYRQTISSMNLIAIDIKLILDGVQMKCHWQLPWHP